MQICTVDYQDTDQPVMLEKIFLKYKLGKYFLPSIFFRVFLTAFSQD